jgi:hypothetical protein
MILHGLPVAAHLLSIIAVLGTGVMIRSDTAHVSFLSRAGLWAKSVALCAFDPGVRICLHGAWRMLQVADPEDACSPFNFQIIDETWVALISRAQQLHPTNCTFDVKVGPPLVGCPASACPCL